MAPGHRTLLTGCILGASGLREHLVPAKRSAGLVECGLGGWGDGPSRPGGGRFPVETRPPPIRLPSGLGAGLRCFGSGVGARRTFVPLGADSPHP